LAATYTSTLPTNKDHIRWLVGDTDVTDAQLSDEEITAVLTEQTATGSALKYYAAAACLGAIRSKLAGKGRGVVEKQVSKLRIRYGQGDSVDGAFESRIKELRREGARRLSPAPYAFKALALSALLLTPTMALAQGGIGGIAARAFPRQMAFANLPAADGTQGVRLVTDCADSDCNAGAGSTIVLMYDDGDSWEPVHSLAGAGSGDIEAVGDCTTGECFQSETARHGFMAPSGGGIATFRALVEADISDLAHTTDTDTTCNDAGVTCLFAGSASESGPATTALALDADPTNCSAGNYPLGIAADGSVQSCTADDTGTDDQTATEVPYTPTTGADWTDPDPTEAGGALDTLAGRLTTEEGAAPLAHASTHEDAGADEISVAGLSGRLADPQPSYTHATDCTSITTGLLGDTCIELDDDTLYSCQPTAGGCDTAGEWILTGDGGGGGIGGSTGATDNAILRADGTGGSTAQASSITVDDSGNLATAGNLETTAGLVKIQGRQIVRQGNYFKVGVAGAEPIWIAGSVVSGNHGLFLQTSGEICWSTGNAGNAGNDSCIRRLGASELTIVDGSGGAATLVSALIRLTPTDAPPTCDATTEGTIYYAASLTEHCACNGPTPSWNQMDGGGTC
jgi:hypothetical protein